MVAERSGSENRSSVCPRYPFPFEAMSSVPRDVPVPETPPKASEPGASTRVATAPSHTGFADETTSEPQPQRPRHGRSTTPSRREDAGEARRHTGTPKRGRAKEVFQSPPSPVQPGSPWTNVAEGVPGNGATAEDIRFWTYNKLGTHYENIAHLAKLGNYLREQVHLIGNELKSRPTSKEVEKYVEEALKDKIDDTKLDEKLHDLSKHVIKNHPGFGQVRDFVHEQVGNSRAAAAHSTEVLSAQVSAAMLQADDAFEKSKYHVKWIEDVDNRFHKHVAESFNKLEREVKEMAGRTHHSCPTPPLGVSPQTNIHDCEIRNGHCWHVENLLKDIKEIKEDHHKILEAFKSGGSKSSELNTESASLGLLQNGLTKLETKVNQHEESLKMLGDSLTQANDRIYFLGGGPYHGDAGGQPQGVPGVSGGHGGYGGAGGHHPHHHGGAGHGPPGADPPGPHGAPGGWRRECPPADDYRTDYSKVFDDKVALSNEYSYSGGDGGNRWRKKTYGYLISKCPTLTKVLKWAEGCDNKSIAKEVWKAENMNEAWMTEINLEKVAEALWGFLNTCLKGEAHKMFENAEELNGFDGWRLVVQEIQRGRSVRKATLRKLVKNPPKITKLEDVNAGMIKYRNILREYEAVGGTPPDDSEQKCDLLDSLPQVIRENLMWRAYNLKDETYLQFQTHVQATVNEILFHRGELPNSINAIDGPHPCDSGVPSEASSNGKSDEIENLLGALLRKFGNRGAPRGRDGGPSSGDRPSRCANCGAKGHTKDECRKPKVPLNQRLCHECGKPGHMAANCPHKKGPNTGAVEEQANDAGDCFSVGWSTAESHGRRGRPTPRVATLGDFFVPTRTSNKFQLLAKSSNDDPCECGCVDMRATKRLAKAIRRAESYQKADQLQQMVPTAETDLMKYEPNDLQNEPDTNDTIGLVYEQDHDSEIMAAEEEIEIEVAMDSGCVAHIIKPKDVPARVEVRKRPNQKDFVNASGGSMENYGEAKIEMTQESGKVINMGLNVTDATRTLQSTSQTCDTGSPACPDGHEVLFTKGVCTVVPDGALSQYLASVRNIAKYPRRGGLYVAKMRVRAPGTNRPKKPGPRKPTQGFARPGTKR